MLFSEARKVMFFHVAASLNTDDIFHLLLIAEKHRFVNRFGKKFFKNSEQALSLPPFSQKNTKNHKKILKNLDERKETL